MTQPQAHDEWTIDGPAFPAQHTDLSTGMSLRQWYAGMALSGIIARNRNENRTADQHAAEARQHADALIAALEYR